MKERAYNPIDQEEKELMDSIGKVAWTPQDHVAEKAKAQADAKNTLARNNHRVSLRSSQ